jgi:protein-S-isoprenylcysteine O-methyltransferase Ste14
MNVAQAATKRVLPPTYLAASLAVMIALHLALPGAVWLHGPVRYLGIVLMLFGATLAVVGSQLFEKHGTTIKPFQESSTLVIEGPFQYSRNPMYAGMVAILAGLALLLGSVTPFLVVPLFVWLISRRFIAAEERALEAKFGQDYEEYKRRVRRWFGRR